MSRECERGLMGSAIASVLLQLRGAQLSIEERHKLLTRHRLRPARESRLLVSSACDANVIRVANWATSEVLAQSAESSGSAQLGVRTLQTRSP